MSRLSKGLACLLLFLVIFSIPPVSADGFFIKYDEDVWSFQPEDHQFAAISYADGKENLLISVGFDSSLRGEMGVWIFPLPADPASVDIGILNQTPAFSGDDLEEEYDDIITHSALVMATYPANPLITLAYFSVYGMSGSMQSKAWDAFEGVEVWETETRMGVTTELVSARDPALLEGYLAKKGLVLPEGAGDVLQEYPGDEYSFVMSYISNVTEFSREVERQNEEMNIYSDARPSISVYASFPTDELYFPLRPTSVYGDAEIPVLLYVCGYVTPDIPVSLVSGTETGYYYDDDYYVNGELEEFFGKSGRISDLRYTRISIHAPSRDMTGDLWMERETPFSVQVMDFFVGQAALLVVFSYLLLSALSGMIGGVVAFRQKRPPIRFMALHGLWNTATIFGLVLATNALRPEGAGYSFGKICDFSGWKWDKTAYIIVFYIVFFLLLGGWSALLLSL